MLIYDHINEAQELRKTFEKVVMFIYLLYLPKYIPLTLLKIEIYL